MTRRLLIDSAKASSWSSGQAGLITDTLFSRKRDVIILREHFLRPPAGFLMCAGPFNVQNPIGCTIEMLTTTAVTTLPSPACKTIYCTQCNRKFGNTKDLQNHIQDSLSHRAAASSLNCEICKKAFKSEKALQQHTRSSPRSHSSLFNCRICDRSFNSEEMLQQHIRDSQAHAASFDCVLCNREFNSNEALQQHLLNSVTHHRRQQQPRTPLDQFFLSFTTFDHDPSEPPAACFNRLRRHQGWRRGDADSNDAWDRYQAALESELRMWYDSGNSLAAWHALCRAIGVDPLPQTCEMCERAVRSIYVNIVDLIEWARAQRGHDVQPVQTFASLEDLRSYTIETKKIYHNRLKNLDEDNVILRHLLRRIFR
uniref:C2H2-type domain-containing protein n=1 Tax=Pyricularia oryzae (strain P131) TaxID=1143193 RepID=L7IPV8_PYRO1